MILKILLLLVKLKKTKNQSFVPLLLIRLRKDLTVKNKLLLKRVLLKS